MQKRLAYARERSLQGPVEGPLASVRKAPTDYNVQNQYIPGASIAKAVLESPSEAA